MLHDSGKVAVRGFDEEMVVVGHEAVCMNYRTVSGHCRFEICQKLLSVFPAFEYVFTFVPPRGYVIVCAGVLYTQCSAHLYVLQYRG